MSNEWWVGVDIGGSKFLLVATGGSRRKEHWGRTGTDVCPADIEREIRDFLTHLDGTTAALGIVGLAIALVPAIVALGVSGAAASAQLAHGSLLTVVALVAALFVAVWLGGLAITAVGAAWRSVLWSVEVGRLPR